MAEYVKVDEEDSGSKKKTRGSRSNFPRIRWSVIILIVIAIFLISSIISGITYSLSPKIAVVPIKGAILTEKSSGVFSTGGTSSREIATILRGINDDGSIKAVVLDINSPGGSPVASEEISRAIEEIDVPVYALISDTGASGAFWVAMSADEVYVSSMSIVGSIGVTSTSLGFEDFIEEYNITYRNLTSGKYKDMGTPFREMKPEEREKIMEILDEIHGNFIRHVAESRNMTYQEVEEYATGEIFLGTTAIEAGFADKIGYYPDVIGDLRNETGVEALVVNYGPTPTLAEELGLTSLFTIPNYESKIELK